MSSLLFSNIFLNNDNQIGKSDSTATKKSAFQDAIENAQKNLDDDQISKYFCVYYDNAYYWGKLQKINHYNIWLCRLISRVLRNNFGTIDKGQNYDTYSNQVRIQYFELPWNSSLNVAKREKLISNIFSPLVLLFRFHWCIREFCLSCFLVTLGFTMLQIFFWLQICHNRRQRHILYLCIHIQTYM